MSAPPSGGGTPIENRRQLIEYFAAGNKPRAAWRMGTEHEKFGFHTATLKPLAYDGPAGIRAMLEGMTRFGWEPVVEGNNPIALQRGKASVTLEPGGQFELSGAPLETLHETAEENAQHLDEVKEVAGEIGAGFIGLGFAPEWKREDMHWMPKGRYKIMREYMPKKGKLGLDMMLRTCTVQTNLDFESEADMVKKFRVSLALQPLATALFANSPFKEGKAAGYKSYRSHIWTDTDPDRCGMLPFVFEDGFGFERYADYMLDVPMYFVYRDGKYIDASGQSFRDFLKGKLPARPGELPTVNDWADHITTAFPEVRLKRFLEMRGADSGPLPALNALPALWVGLLYDQTRARRGLGPGEGLDRRRPRLPAQPRRRATGLATRCSAAAACRMGARGGRDRPRRAARAQAARCARQRRDDLPGAARSRGGAAAWRRPTSCLAKWQGEWQGSFAPLFRDYAY